jgi:glycogen debranching enzyme
MKRRTLLRSGLVAGLAASGAGGAPVSANETFDLNIPTIRTGDRTLDRAWRIAAGDLAGNVTLFRSGMLEREVPVLLAGLGYPTPWTRDASINAWNGVSILMPGVARNTLLAVLEHTGNGVRITGGNQYWDSIVWATGAWHHYLVTGDRHFLALAFEAVTNSLAFYESTEFDPEDGLFRGPGWSDGVSGYPAEYADCLGESGINLWPKMNPDKVSRAGYGIPMKALSTNCLYYNAYVVRAQMARELGLPSPSSNAAQIREAINSLLWNPETGRYRYVIGPFGSSDHQEALGHAYALLFGIAPDERARAVLTNQFVAPAGVPCVWPNFERYTDGFARHAGTVWPQIQGMWAHAAAQRRNTSVFGHELFQLARHAFRDNQFAEIYHPFTGEIYGGLQERRGRGVVLWESQPRQSWAASAYVRMLLFGLLGMEVTPEGVRFAPCVPAGIEQIEVTNLMLRGLRLDVVVRRTGARKTEESISWQSLQGRQTVALEVE